MPASFEQVGMALWRVEPPLRMSRRITGLRPNGDLHGHEAARIEVLGCEPGELQLTILGKEGRPTRIRLGGEILAELCRRTERAAYCSASRRFARYETEPPRIAIAPLRDLRARRAAPLQFTLSKGSAVRVRVYGPRGVVLARDLQLERGGHDLTWTPPTRGRFHVRVAARGPEGRLGTAGRTVRVVKPKPKPKHKPERRARERAGAERRS